MDKRFAALLAAAMLAAVVALAGCSSGGSGQAAGGDTGSSAPAETTASTEAAEGQLAPGEYEAEFNTDSSMFHANESKDGKGVLTVQEDGSMVLHVSLESKRIVNLYPGTAADAENDEANWLQPTTDEVTYSDGYTKDVYGFDIPVPAIDEEFDLALLGEKGKWYDHKVQVNNPVPLEG